MSQPALFLPDEAYVRGIVDSHLDEELGTPYWVERDRRLGRKAREKVRSFEDLKRWIGFADLAEQRQFERDTRFLPLEQFIPRRLLRSGDWIWASQTGATTGPAKHGCWSKGYWDRVLEFSDELLDLHRVPRQTNWLFIGPTGPHTTGRLVISMAERRGGRCFSIDLDPRIVKIFGGEGMQAAHDRYIRHIWDQVDPILRYQDVGVLFCTSRLLEQLPDRVEPKLLKKVRAVIHAGTTMTRDTNRLLASEVFPGTPIVGIYGTSTTGIHFQKPSEPDDDHRVIYIPCAPYVMLELVDDAGAIVDYGQEGHMATYRMTEDSLIPGFWERDRAVRVRPFGAIAARYRWDWVEGPYSPEFTVGGKFEGVY